MKYTPNLNLKKPDYTDLADIPAHFNGNMDTIDAELKENADAIVSVGTELSNHGTQQLIDFEKKVDKVDGKGLSDVNYTALEKVEVAKIPTIESNLGTLDTNLTQHKLDYTEQRQQDQFKVATVEKGLNDYKSTLANVNVNQESKQKSTGYGVVSLPKNTANGQVSVGVKGETRTNIFDKGYFNVNKLVSSATYGVIYKLKPNTTYTVSTNAVKYGVPAVIYFGGGDSIGSGVNIGNPKTKTTDSNGNVSLYIRYSLAPDSIAPDEQTFNKIMSGEYWIMFEEGGQVTPYINGTKSTVSASRLKSVGKNLLPIKQGSSSLRGVTVTIDNEGYITLNGTSTGVVRFKVTNGLIGSSSGINPEWFKEMIVPCLNTLYSLQMTDISGTTSDNGYPALDLVDENGVNKKTYFNSISSGIVPWTNTGSYKFSSLFIVITGGVTLNNYKFRMQLQYGNVKTPYEPYTESETFLPNVGDLRSLPNGTKDEVRVSGNKAEHVKRTSESILKGSEGWIAYPDIQTEVLGFYASASDSLPNILPKSSIGEIKFYASNYSNTSYNDIVAPKGILNINYESLEIQSNIIKITVSKTKVTNISTFRTWLVNNPITLTYQLAEPIITPIDVSGNLISYPSGTVYVEKVVADAGIYTTKFDIKDIQLPIKSVDKLIKYNFTTGVQTVLDTTLAVINVDKKSFTHPNLADKDMVFVDYYYDVESTLGETTIEYLDSRHTIEDTTNSKFYSWNIKSTNGVPTVVLTEVL